MSLAVPDPARTFADDAFLTPVARAVLRTDFAAPGFALLDLGPSLTPRDFRSHLAALGEGLSRHAARHLSGPLGFVSVSTFDQQTPTRPHRDGGPDASVLLLGYEPTEVVSRVFLLDYARCAHDRDQTPKEFLDCCNPAFQYGHDLLRDYTTELTDFTPGHYQIVALNNSCLPWEERHRGMLGVLHHAVITPRPGRPRPVDSMLMGADAPSLTPEEVRRFVEDGVGVAR